MVAIVLPQELFQGFAEMMFLKTVLLHDCCCFRVAAAGDGVVEGLVGNGRG